MSLKASQMLNATMPSMIRNCFLSYGDLRNGTTFWKELSIRLRFSMTIKTVGCIYASEPFNSSLIYYQHLFHSNSIIKHQKQLKFILSIFLVFLLTLFPCHLYFLRYMSYKGLSHLLPSRPFDSGSRKCLPTHRLYPTIWPPDGQGTKVPGK